MRELSPVCVPVPDKGPEKCKNRSYLQGERYWSGKSIQEIYKQAEGGGVLLSSMGNPEKYPVYFDKILLNASQVTNPSIDLFERAYGNQGLCLVPKPRILKGTRTAV